MGSPRALETVGVATVGRSDEFHIEGYDRSKDYELDRPNPNRRYTVVSHHGADRDNPEVRKQHFDTFAQAQAYGQANLPWKAIPNPNMSYTEKDGYSGSIWEHNHTDNKWGVVLKSVKRNGRWVPDRGEDD